MRKFKVEFHYQDRSVRGFNLKSAKRTVKAASAEDAIRKIEQAMTVTVISPKVTEEE